MPKKTKGKVCKYCIVKRRGHEEEFDEKKVYASCYAACLSAHIEHMKSEKICDKVAKEIKAWARKKRAIDSTEIFKKTIATINKHDKNAAFMYKTHRDIA
jgi:transcriptional regulator NrdR family protein